jgi:hypothetical protein
MVRWLSCFAIASVFALSAAPLACGSSGGGNGDNGGGGDDGGLDGVAPTGDDGGGPGANDGGGPNGNDSGPGATCGAPSSACTKNAECCSDLCLGHVCVASIAQCGAAGDKCAVGTDCCTGACVNGACSAAQCVSIGQPCPSSGNACCTDTCVAGKCAPIGAGTDGGAVGACTTAGNSCTGNAECCSGLCTNGKCNIASSYCIQNGDICFTGADCCGGVCQSPDSSPVSATNPGTCTTIGTSCGVDGTLCDPAKVGCSAGCCSALCAPFGPTGVPICQQAQGCRVQGDLCKKDSDCCGGEPEDAGILGAGLVVCNLAPGQSIGVCSPPNPTNGGHNSCIPAGDVCQYNHSNSDGGYACPSSAQNANCCDGQTPDKYLCQLDKLGIPRCLAYTGDSDAGLNACRQNGQTCATAADCCDGTPCVPGPGGQLVCGSSTCVPSNGACTSNADCCAGVTCVIPVGSLSGTCAPLPPPPGGGGSGDGGAGGDGGSGGGGGLGCADLGQSCASVGCCTGLVCSGGACVVIR